MAEKDKVVNPDEIDIDDDEYEEEDDADAEVDENAIIKNVAIEKQAIPDKVFGGLKKPSKDGDDADDADL